MYIVVYDLLAAMGMLTNEQFMKHELLDNLTRFLGVHNEGSTVQALSQLIYWNKEQLMSGDFRILAPGLIDVCFLFISQVLRRFPEPF